MFSLSDFSGAMEPILSHLLGVSVKVCEVKGEVSGFVLCR